MLETARKAGPAAAPSSSEPASAGLVFPTIESARRALAPADYGRPTLAAARRVQFEGLSRLMRPRFRVGR
jgi:hypothetical protein